MHILQIDNSGVTLIKLFWTTTLLPSPTPILHIHNAGVENAFRILGRKARQPRVYPPNGGQVNIIFFVKKLN
jgi:hypothetical protein